MIDPSGITLPEGQEFIINETKTGEFIVENAYDGDYEYFTGRPTSVKIGFDLPVSENLPASSEEPS